MWGKVTNVLANALVCFDFVKTALTHEEQTQCEVQLFNLWGKDSQCEDELL